MSSAPLAPAAYSLAAVLAWGTSDFLGGYASRRANVFVFTAIVNAGGLLMMTALLGATHAPLPSARSALWALAGGVSGGASLAVFYRALSTGKMGLAAPVAAVLSAAIPTLFSMITEGLPGPVRSLGFVLAVVGLWLITRSEDGGTPEGIELAILAGLGFAGFYLCVRQGGDASVFWIASLTRAGGLLATVAIVLVLRALGQVPLRDLTSAVVPWAVLIGCIDSLGTILFVRASQSGRLDEAVVLSSLYPAITVLLARLFLKEHFTRWKMAGIVAALAAVPMIARG